MTKLFTQPNNFISYLKLILNFPVNINTNFKKKIELQDFNDFSKLNQSHLLIYELIVSKKSFTDLFSVNSLCTLKERMS
jgi:hypothetical protein